jgi:hypothetical protein
MDNLVDVVNRAYQTLCLLPGHDALETVPTLLIVNVCFSVVYNQMNGPFQSHACQMNLWVGSIQLNAAFFNIADCIAIIVFVPILEKIAYPLIGRMKGSPVTLKQKLVAGLAVAGFSMVVAAGLEYLRRGLPILGPKGEVATPDCCLYGMNQIKSYLGSLINPKQYKMTKFLHPFKS